MYSLLVPSPLSTAKNRYPLLQQFIPKGYVHFKGSPTYANNLEVSLGQNWGNPAFRETLKNHVIKDLFLHDQAFGRMVWTQFQTLKNSGLDGLELMDSLRRTTIFPNQTKVDVANNKWHEGRTEALTTQMTNLVQTYAKLPQDPVYLDVGCGEGHITKKVADKLGIRNSNVYPLEISENATSPFQANDLTILTYNGQHIPDRIPKPDVVTLNSVLHHTGNEAVARDLLKDIYQKMKPGGYLIIREANISSSHPEDRLRLLYAQIRHLLSIRVAGRISSNMPPDVLYKRNSEWQDIARDMGFKVLATDADTSRSEMGGTFNMMLQKTKK
jgi:2-polyprenyl-3-methyl-5-hydroxy-6-metoxy-1,4-benzoquinol methylase